MPEDQGTRRARFDAWLDKWVLTPIARIVGLFIGSDGF
jgi:hypothetical protein